MKRKKESQWVQLYRSVHSGNYYVNGIVYTDVDMALALAAKKVPLRAPYLRVSTRERQGDGGMNLRGVQIATISHRWAKKIWGAPTEPLPAAAAWDLFCAYVRML